MLDLAGDGVRESPCARFEAVSDVEHDRIGGLLLEEAFPFGGGEGIVEIWRERTCPESDDLLADLHDELRKSVRVPGTRLDFDVGKARIGAQRRDVFCNR